MYCNPYYRDPQQGKPKWGNPEPYMRLAPRSHFPPWYPPTQLASYLAPKYTFPPHPPQAPASTPNPSLNFQSLPILPYTNPLHLTFSIVLLHNLNTEPQPLPLTNPLTNPVKILHKRCNFVSQQNGARSLVEVYLTLTPKFLLLPSIRWATPSSTTSSAGGPPCSLYLPVLCDKSESTLGLLCLGCVEG